MLPIPRVVFDSLLEGESKSSDHIPGLESNSQLLLKRSQGLLSGP